MTDTWEQAVIWLRAQANEEWLVRACYYDDPLLVAAERFASSDEWAATRRLIPDVTGKVLDLGAGRGISSYALARDGWVVTALEPDPSPLVGAAAIRELAQAAGLALTVVEEYGEQLSFEDATFDLVYARQVLHHARNLSSLCREVARVLKPGGRLFAAREHVISKPEDLEVFLANHPLHKLYGGENAYLASEYLSAISASGLRIVQVLGPYDTVINYFPMTFAEWYERCTSPLAKVMGRHATLVLTDQKHVFGRWLLKALSTQRSASCSDPGRLYSFVAERLEHA